MAVQNEFGVLLIDVCISYRNTLLYLLIVYLNKIVEFLMVLLIISYYVCFYFTRAAATPRWSNETAGLAGSRRRYT